MESFLPPSSEFLHLPDHVAPPTRSTRISLTAPSPPRNAPSSQSHASQLHTTSQQHKGKGKETATPPLTSGGNPAESLPLRAARNAASWNSSLLYERKKRGPQWDFGTRMYAPLFCLFSFYASPNDTAGTTSIKVARPFTPASLRSLRTTLRFVVYSATNLAHLVSLSSSAKTTSQASAPPSVFNTGSNTTTAPTTAGNYDSGRPRRSKAATGAR